MKDHIFQNPQLDGGPFFLEGGPTGILLSHGFTATTAEVRPLAERLHAHGYTVAAPLLPGHNTHPRDLNRVTWQDWLAAFEEMYARLASRCEAVVTGGESTGALLALLHASRHPEVRGLLLYAPALRLNLTALDRFRLRLLAPFVPWVRKANADDSMPWKGYWVNPLKGTLQLLKLQDEVRAALPRVTAPLLVVQGRLDQTVHPSVPDEILNRVRASIKESHWMEQSTHCVILDRERDAVAEITLRFLEAVIPW